MGQEHPESPRRNQLATTTARKGVSPPAGMRYPKADLLSGSSVMAEGTVDYYAMVEEAWQLSDAARDYVKNAGREVGNEELWEKLFATSPLLDVERTRAEGGQPLQKIFFKNPYGLQYRADHKDWIPFRHGALDPAYLQVI
jgi:hypothetical protein